MRKFLLRLILLFVIAPSANVWAVAIYCTDAQVSGIGTLVNDIYMDASDWSMGTLDPAVTFQGPNPGNLQIFNSYIDLTVTPSSYIRYTFSTPHYGTNWVYGEGSAGWLVPGPEGGYVIGDKPSPCSHPKYYPEPEIDSFVISPSSVVEGDTVNVTWSTSGDVFTSNGCNVGGTTYASSGSITMVATLGLAGTHTMVCENNYGYSLGVSRYLAVAAFVPNIEILQAGPILNAQAVYNEGLRYTEEDATCQELYDAFEYPLSSCNSSILIARSVSGGLYSNALYTPVQQYIIETVVTLYVNQIIELPLNFLTQEQKALKAMFDFTSYVIEIHTQP